MPQLPAWNRTVSLVRAAQAREAEVRAAATAAAGGAFERCTELPRAIVENMARRFNVLDLATKHDVEAQSRLSRKRLSNLLEQFLDAQQAHDDRLVSSLRSELREELQSFATAVSDDLFALNAMPTTDKRLSRDELDQLHDLDDLLSEDDEDDVDLTEMRGGSWSV